MSNRYERERSGSGFNEEEERYSRDAERRQDFERGQMSRESERGGQSDRFGGYERNSGGRAGWERERYDQQGGSYGRQGSPQDWDSYSQGYGPGFETEGGRQGPRGGQEWQRGQQNWQGYGGQGPRGGQEWQREQGYGQGSQGVQQSFQQDWQRSQGGQQCWSQGPHTGRGPKGWQRSDERIREEVCECLTQHGYLDASEIEIQVKQGEVTLTGFVDDRQAKRMAEDSLEGISGIRDINNQLRVHQHDQRQQESQQGGQRQQGSQQQGNQRGQERSKAVGE